MQAASNPVLPLLAHVQTRGGNVAALCAQVGLAPAEAFQRELTVSPTLKAATFLAAARMLGDDHVGIAVALGLPRGAFGLVEYCTLNAPNLLGAMERMSRFARLLDPAAEFRVRVAGARARLSFQAIRTRQGGARHVHEYTMAMLVNMGRDVVGKAWNPVKVAFANPPPAKPTELQRMFGTTALVFDAPANELTLDRALLDLPVIHADPALLAVLEAAAVRELAAVPQSQADVVSLASHVVRRSFRDGPPSLHHTARALHMSPRTLQRRLGAEKWSYQRVVEQVREDTAMELLKKPGTALSEVAFFLGFTDFSTFLRAFKRWTGTTPGRWRLQHK
jgi:AraC-like DNA-binding protein